MSRLLKLLCLSIPLVVALPTPARAEEVLPAIIVRAAVANRPEDYVLTTEADREKINPGDQVTFLITFSNRGGLSANNVRIASQWDFATDEFLSFDPSSISPIPLISPIFDFPEKTLTWLLPEVASGKTITFKFTLKIKPTHAYAGTYQVATRASLKSGGVSKEAGPIDHTVDYKIPQPPLSPFVFETKNPKLTADLGQLTVDFQRIKLLAPELPFSKIKMYPTKNLGIDVPVADLPTEASAKAGSPAPNSSEPAEDKSPTLGTEGASGGSESDSGESAGSDFGEVELFSLATTVCQFNIDGHLVTGLVQAGTCSGVINTPEAVGFYEVFIRLTDPTLGFLETKLFNLQIVRRPRVLDKEGQPIPEAEVTLYRFNPTTNKFEVWNTSPSHQENSIITNEAGKYEFIVPQGKYYLYAEAWGFKPHAFEWFEMSRPGPITKDLTLERTAISKIAFIITKVVHRITLTLRLIRETLAKIPLLRLFRLLGWPLLILLLVYLLHLLSQHLGLPFWLLLPYLLFLLKKQAKPWGRVTDSENGQPIPGVRIKLRSTGSWRGKEPGSWVFRAWLWGIASLVARLGNRPALETTFTNQQGELGFHQPPGRYIFEIFKRGYTIDTEKQAVNTKPVIVTEKMVMLEWDGKAKLRIILKRS